MVSTYVCFYLKGVYYVYVYMRMNAKCRENKSCTRTGPTRCLRILFRNQSYRSSAHDFLFVLVFFSWAALTLALLHKGSPTMRSSGNNGALRKKKKRDCFVSFRVIP